MAQAYENQVRFSSRDLDMAIARGRTIRSEAYRSAAQGLFAGVSRLARSIRVSLAKRGDAKPAFGKTA